MGSNHAVERDWYGFAEDAAYAFALKRGNLHNSKDVHDELSRKLALALVDPKFVEHILTACGQDEVRAYLESRGVGIKLNTRVGDFGEVVAADVLETTEGLAVPIFKLRYRETTAWAMRLTDVFAVRHADDGEIEAFCFTSAKAGVTRPPRSVAVEGYQQLVADERDASPEILWFVRERLFEAGQYEECARFDRVSGRPGSVTRLFRLVLVFDSALWNEAALAELNDALTPLLREFRAYVVLTPELRSRVEECYGNAAAGWIGS